ncbi:MAG: outer membrane lipid asymmetry maintenance protein MlaD [Pseudomonadota bacterium]
MKRSVVETLLGAVVIIVAAVFFLYSAEMAGVNTPTGLIITADFSEIGGLKAGDAVQISGVKVGSVANVELVPESYLARVTMNVDASVELPTDTGALISSESLLGGRYLALEPGADEIFLENGGHINYTQAPQNLEQLLGQFIFNAADESSE